MKTEYEFMNMDKIPFSGKTTKWIVETKAGIALGKISWYGSWRQYCFYPEPVTVFSQGCIEDISNFIDQLAKIRSMQKSKKEENESST